MSEEHNESSVNHEQAAQSSTALSTKLVTAAKIAVVAATMTLASCASVPQYSAPTDKNHTHEEGVKAEDQTNAARAGALVNPEANNKIYLLALENADHIDKFGNPKKGLDHEHVINWGRQMGGANLKALFTGKPFVDPTEEFQIDKGFQPDHPQQTFYAMPNGTVITTFYEMPDAEKFSTTATTQSGSGQNRTTTNYSSITEADVPTKILPSDVEGVLAAMEAEKIARSGYQHGVLGNPDNHDPTDAGGWRDAVESRQNRDRNVPENFSAEQRELERLRLENDILRNNNGGRPDIVVIDGTNNQQRDSEEGVGSARFTDENGQSHNVIVRSDGRDGTPDRVIIDGETVGAVHSNSTPEKAAKDVAHEIEEKPEFLQKLLKNGSGKASGISTDDGFYR